MASNNWSYFYISDFELFMISKLAKEYYLVWSIPIALLILAPFSWPYGYYTFLRIVLTFSAALICYLHISSKQNKYVIWIVIFGLLALLYNPLIQVHLHKYQWLPINIATALIYFTNLVYLVKFNKE